MNYFIRQIGQNDCGITSLKMLLAIVYKRSDFLYYPHGDINKKSSLHDIMHIALKEGVRLSAFRYSEKKEIFKNKKNVPLLIVLTDEFKNRHMVLVKKVKKNSLTICDPKRGIYNLEFKDLMKVWNGEALEIIEVKGSDYKKPKINIYPKTFLAFSLTFECLSFISLFLAMLFIDPGYSFIIPVSLFTLFVLFEFAYQKIVVIGLKKFDGNIVNNSKFLASRSNFKSYYEPLNKYKYSIVSTPISLMSAILIIIFGVFLLGINDPYNLLILGTTFILIVVFKLIDKKYWSLRKANLEDIERKLFYQTNLSQDEFKNSVEVLNDETYRYVTFVNFKKYFLLFFTIALCLVYLGFTGFVNINYMLFHFFIYVYLQEQFNKLLEIDKQLGDLKNYKNLYAHYFN